MFAVVFNYEISVQLLQLHLYVVLSYLFIFSNHILMQTLSQVWQSCHVEGLKGKVSLETNCFAVATKLFSQPCLLFSCFIEW